MGPRFLLLIFVMGAGCSSELSHFEHTCKTLSENYKEVLSQKSTIKKFQVYSWKTLKAHHQKILPQLIANWPQIKAVESAFSDLYFSLLKPRVDLACGKEHIQETWTQQTVKEGIVKKTSKILDSPFSTCLNKEYLLSSRFIFQACLTRIKKK